VPRPTIQTRAPPALLGTYHRVFQDADRRAAHDPGLSDWVGSTFTITIKTGWIDVTRLDLLEYYTASGDGQLTVLGYLPTNGGSFCSLVPTEAPPPGSYRWERRGKRLIITRAAFDPCLDRGALLPGTWTKIG
jgi:hypothetical protein